VFEDVADVVDAAEILAVRCVFILENSLLQDSN
jgi:hypothetical protein